MIRCVHCLTILVTHNIPILFFISLTLLYLTYPTRPVTDTELHPVHHVHFSYFLHSQTFSVITGNTPSNTLTLTSYSSYFYYLPPTHTVHFSLLRHSMWVTFLYTLMFCCPPLLIGLELVQGHTNLLLQTFAPDSCFRLIPGATGRESHPDGDVEAGQTARLLFPFTSRCRAKKQRIWLWSSYLHSRMRRTGTLKVIQRL